MLIQALAITQEEISIAVNEFIVQFAPQFEKWSAIIVGVMTGLALIISFTTFYFLF